MDFDKLEAEILALVKAQTESHRRALIAFSLIWMVVGIGAVLVFL